MHTRTALLSASLVSLALAAPSLFADDCSATATFKQVTKEAKSAPPAKPGAMKRPATPNTYTLQFEIEISGCPESPQRHSKFAGPTHGTLTYSFKKTYVDRSTAEAKENVTWSENPKTVVASGKVEGLDGKGVFEVGDVKVERTVCGCR